MTSAEFINIYWSQYILIEKEFMNTLYFLALDDSNENSYSQAYLKLMLEIGSEIDVVFKEYCRTIDPTFATSYRTIVHYKNSINNNNPDFITQQVLMTNYNKHLYPWIEWSTLPGSPNWWTAYNMVKHRRTNMVEIEGVRQVGYKFANQKYTLLALSGLYQIMVYFYEKISSDEGKRIVTPLPGSRLFKLSGGKWDQISFYGDSAFYIKVETGELIWVTGTIHY